jgi:hypothetical protein
LFCRIRGFLERENMPVGKAPLLPLKDACVGTLLWVNDKIGNILRDCPAVISRVDAGGSSFQITTLDDMCESTEKFFTDLQPELHPWQGKIRLASVAEVDTYLEFQGSSRRTLQIIAKVQAEGRNFSFVEKVSVVALGLIAIPAFYDVFPLLGPVHEKWLALSKLVLSLIGLLAFGEQHFARSDHIWHLIRIAVCIGIATLSATHLTRLFPII